MRKLFMTIAIFVCTLSAKAQAYSGEAVFGANTSYTVSIDTTVLRDGSKFCRHYYQSANVEQEIKSQRYAVLKVKSCLPREEDRLICTRCLRHLKVVYNNECLTVLPYSELLKRIETADQKREQ